MLHLLLVSIAYLIILQLPGILVLRGLRVNLGKAICAAPILSLATVAVLGEINAAAGIFCTPLILLAPIYIAATAIYIVCRYRCSRMMAKTDVLQIRYIALFLVVGIGIGYWIFLRAIQSPSATMEQSDAINHYNLIRSILDTGTYSSLKANVYSSFAGTDSAFYPSLWHEACALAVAMFDVDVATSTNIVNFMFAFEIFPLAMLLLLSKVFNDDSKILPFAVCSIFAFQVFPWGLLYWGPIWPNLAGFAAMPISAWLFMETVEAFQENRYPLIHSAVFLLSCVGLFLLHSNALFTCVYYLVPWCIYEIRKTRRYEILGRRVSCNLLSIAFILLVILILVVLFRLPMLQGVVTFYWGLAVDPIKELVNILTLDYVGDFYPTVPQPILGVLVAAGYVLALRSHDLRWTAASYTIAVIVCMGEAVLPAPWKNYFSGFWYTDPFRVAAMAAIFAMPLAAYAVASFYKLLKRYLFHVKATTDSSYAGKAAALLFMLTIIAATHVANLTLPVFGQTITPFGQYEVTCRSLYDKDNQPLSATERSFIRRAKEIVGDSVVLSYPGNGSAAAYGLDGINTLYRTATPADSLGKREGADNFAYIQSLIAARADKVASDPAVQSAMQDIEAKYVLVLPTTTSDYEYDRFADQTSYAGLLAVGEDTPGYHLVMEEDGMKLLETTFVEGQ